MENLLLYITATQVFDPDIERAWRCAKQCDSSPLCVQGSLVHSHWSRNVKARLSLVESFIVMLRQLSYAIKNQLVAYPQNTPIGNRGEFCLLVAVFYKFVSVWALGS